jgi:hypothetical protein
MALALMRTVMGKESVREVAKSMKGNPRDVLGRRTKKAKAALDSIKGNFEGFKFWLKETFKTGRPRFLTDLQEFVLVSVCKTWCMSSLPANGSAMKIKCLEHLINSFCKENGVFKVKVWRPWKVARDSANDAHGVGQGDDADAHRQVVQPLRHYCRFAGGGEATAGGVHRQDARRRGEGSERSGGAQEAQACVRAGRHWSGDTRQVEADQD